MAKKKRKEFVYDEETGGVVELSTDAADSGEECKKSGPDVKLNTMLVQSFTATWRPATDDNDASVERMRLIDLRTYFQCYTTDDCRCIDLLPFYMDELSQQGYQLRTDSMGQPYLPVKRM